MNNIRDVVLFISLSGDGDNDIDREGYGIVDLSEVVEVALPPLWFYDFFFSVNTIFFSFDSSTGSSGLLSIVSEVSSSPSV